MTKLRVTYGLDKVADGAFYHEQHIIDDLKALAVEATPLPKDGLPATDVKGIDTEYAPDGELLTVGFASGGIAAGMEWVHSASKSIAARAMRETNWLVGHNIPGDIDQFASAGLPITEDWYAGRKIIDTFVLAKMLDENKPRGSYGLEQLMLTNYNVQPWKGPTEEKLKNCKCGHPKAQHHVTMDLCKVDGCLCMSYEQSGDARDWTPEERESRCKMDAWATFMLAKKFWPLVTHQSDGYQNRLLVETIHRISMTLYRIGLAGAKVDRDYLYNFKLTASHNAAVHEHELRVCSHRIGWDGDKPFSPTNDEDIRHILFDLLGLKPISTSKGGKPKVDKVSLKVLADGANDLHAVMFINTLLAYNKAQKTSSIYSDIDNYIDKDGFLHFWLNQLGARTGRRSSGGGTDGTPSSKNAQNWPPEAKHMIVSRFDGGVIGAFDYQSLEPILAAYLSQDMNLADFFYNGRGYLDICKRVLKKDIEKTSPIYKAIKSMSLGLFYNMQDKLMATNLWNGVMMDAPFKFSEDWNEHLKQTGIYRKQILGLFPGWVRYMERQKIRLANDQQIVAPDGYVRHLPHHGKGSEGYWKLVNQSINFPVQHLASMVTGCAMIDCEAALLKKYGLTYREWQQHLHDRIPGTYSIPHLINEVHDELTWDFPKEHKADMELILDTMSSPPSLTKLIPDLTIKLKIEAKINERW